MRRLPRLKCRLAMTMFECGSILTRHPGYAKTFVFTFLLVAACFVSLPCGADVRNLTEENRAALSEKVQALSRSELMRSARGRAKTNPVLLPYIQPYQVLMQDQAFLLAGQLEDYRAALLEMQRATDEFKDFTSTTLGASAARTFNQKLISAYSLKDGIGRAASLGEIWQLLIISRIKLQSIPVEFRLALNAGRWLSRMDGGAQTGQGALDQYLLLCNADLAPTNIFDADTRITELSKKFAAIMLGLSEKKQ